MRYGIRTLIKSPGFTAIAILTLSLGIGANTAFFSVVNGVLLNPLPYRNPSELVALYAKAPGYDRASLSYLNFLDWQRDTQSLASIALYHNEDYNLTGSGEPERVSGFMTSASFFDTLGVHPVVGRTFRADDDRLGAEAVAVLGGGFWQRRFGSAPDVIGRAIILNGIAHTIVGVIPARFSLDGHARDVYTPVGQWREPSFRDRRIVFSSAMLGRLNNGVTLAQATADMQGVARSLATTYPEANRGIEAVLVPMKQDVIGDVQPILLVLFGAVGFLLLIACANVANLLLARSMSRSREFAVRLSLGASRRRVVQQLLTESVLLAAIGGTLGVLFALWGTRAVIGVLPGALPRASEVSLDARVLLFTLGVSLLTGVLFGLAPALKASRVDLQEVLKEGGRGSVGRRHRLQELLVVVAMAMALVLLVGAGLMTRSIAALWRVNPGFNPSQAITFSVSLPAPPAPSSAETIARLGALDDSIRSISAVEAVSLTLGSRPMLHGSSEAFWIEGRPRPANVNEMNQAMFSFAEAGFVQAMGMTLKGGRFIAAQDTEHAPLVIVIDEVFARTFFPAENPIGKHVHLATFNVQAEIVGIVNHVKQWGLDDNAKWAVEAQFYYPFRQAPENVMRLAATSVAVVLRTQGDPAQIAGSVRRAVVQLNPGAVVYNVITMDDVVANSYAARRFAMILFGVFASMALMLACIGIYGVITYLVGQRTHEIGLRIALGAKRVDVLRLVLGRGTAVAGVGVAVGVIAALGLTQFMAHELFGVSAHDPATFAGVAVVLLTVAVAACYIPAHRATTVDPMIALRHE